MFVWQSPLPFPFGPRRGAAQEEDDRRTTPGIGPLEGRDDPGSFVPNRPGPRSPLAGPLHPFLGAMLGLRIDARARAKLDGVPRIAPRVTITVAEAERIRGLRGVTSRLRTPPASFGVPYNAAPLGPGSALQRPLPGMNQPPAGDLPCVGCR